MKLYSNPIRFEDDEFTYIPKGDKSFCVCCSSDHWIPLNAMVFSDTKENAEKVIVDALKWLLKRAPTEAYSTSTRTKEYYQKVLDLPRLCTIVQINQLFKIGWADNDTL